MKSYGEGTVRLRRTATATAFAVMFSGLIPIAAQAAAALPVQLSAQAVDGLSVSLTDADSAAGQTYSINWGDGTSPTSSADGSGKHAYEFPGTYTITETVSDTSGDTGSASTSFTTAGSLFYPTGPTRFLDTRQGIGGPVAKVPAGGTRTLQIGGVDGLPTGITAVSLNLTAVDGTAGGYVTAYADGTQAPAASNLNYGVGVPVANSAIVPVGSDGAIDFQVTSNVPTSSVDLIADVSGYYTRTIEGEPYGFAPVQPARLLDTRIGVGAPKAKVGPHQSIFVSTVAAIGEYLYSYGNTAAASLHVTVTDATANGFITAYDGGSGQVPNASTLNFAAGQTVSNTVNVSLGGETGGDGFGILLYNGSSASVDLVLDVTGYYATTGYAYVPVTPDRVLDTRTSAPLQSQGEVYTNADPQISQDAVALAANLTATEATGDGYLIADPYSPDPLPSSSLNYGVGETVASFAQAGAAGGVLAVANDELSGTVEVIVDAFGYYASEWSGGY